MNHTEIFLHSDGRLRAGWRLLLFIVAFMLTGMAIRLLPLPLRESFEQRILLGMLVRTVATIVVSTALMRLLERRQFRDIGLRQVPGWGGAVALGGAAGAALLAIVAAALLAVAGVQFTPDTPGPVQALLLWTLILVIGAASEEILFRGYPFQVLVEGVGPIAATVAASILFAAAHRSNPAVTELSTVNTALAGAMLSLAYLRSRSLWYPISLHLSWNWTMAALGFPLSGLVLPNFGWVPQGPAQTAWLHGGAYGPEGGVVCSVVMVMMITMLALRPAWVGCRALATAPEPPRDLIEPPTPQTIFTTPADPSSTEAN